jgi:DNA-binding transcriptional LysR family regulator
MDRLDAMRLFTRIVARRSFAQAAKDLQIPRPTVTYAIKQLEDYLGTRLLERTTRQVSLTADGAAYYERCVRLLADLDETESAFRHVTPKGPLRVDLQGSLANQFVVPALPGFMALYPDIVLRISETDRVIDLIQEGVDCVLRVGGLKDSSLVGKRVACFEWVTCATPAYLERYGVPQSLDDLADHHMVGYLDATSGQRFPLEFCQGDELKLIELPHVVTVTGALINFAAGTAGLGLVQIPRFKADPLLNRGYCRWFCRIYRRHRSRSGCYIRRTACFLRACGCSLTGFRSCSPRSHTNPSQGATPATTQSKLVKLSARDSFMARDRITKLSGR